jgi:hypothetical protein
VSIECTQDDSASYIRTLLATINYLADVEERLTAERDRARDIAAMLEAECSKCWGPVHSQAIKTARLDAFYSEGWEDDGA